MDAPRASTYGWRLLALAAAAALALLLLPPQGDGRDRSAASSNAPPRGEVFFGVTDTGRARSFGAFAAAVDKHPAVVETYHPWGNSLNQAMPRWRQIHARPLLHISTVDPQSGRELITPKQIARGRGDNYLLRLNRRFATTRVTSYIRPLGEPNRCLNAWTAVRCDGSGNGGGHRAVWYRRAFRRMYLLLHGGGTLREIDKRLRRLGLPRVQRRGGREPRKLPRAPIAVIWSPLPGGSPGTPGNAPVNYYPGHRFVDWVGTDVYSRYTDFGALQRFYRAYARHKPFAITEFGVWGSDDPAFVRHLMRWAQSHRQTRMLVYYQDFGRPNPFRIQGHPHSLAALKRALRSARFPPLAPDAPHQLRRATSN